MGARKTFRTWLPEHGETEETGEDVEVGAFFDACDAAEARHERFNDYGDHTEWLTVHVRDGERVRVFECECRAEPAYYSHETKASREAAK